MSSILKALKRIEVLSPRSEKFFTMPQTIDPKQANISKTRRRWFAPSLIVIILALLVVIVAAMVIFSRRQPVIAKKFQTEVSEKQSENPASLLEKSNIFKAKIPINSTNPTEESTRKAQLAKNQMKSALPDGKVINKPANAPVDQKNSTPTTTVQSPQPGRTTPLKKPQQKRPASQDTVAAKSVPSGKPATKPKKSNKARKYERMDDAKLKLQALAWFSDASKRMAVINSHIVREGGSVDGYQVTQIRRQDVVVSDGSKSWRLVFGLKH